MRKLHFLIFFILILPFSSLRCSSPGPIRNSSSHSTHNVFPALDITDSVSLRRTHSYFHNPNYYNIKGTCILIAMDNPEVVFERNLRNTLTFLDNPMFLPLIVNIPAGFYKEVTRYDYGKALYKSSKDVFDSKFEQNRIKAISIDDRIYHKIKSFFVEDVKAKLSPASSNVFLIYDSNIIFTGNQEQSRILFQFYVTIYNGERYTYANFRYDSSTHPLEFWMENNFSELKDFSEKAITELMYIFSSIIRNGGNIPTLDIDPTREFYMISALNIKSYKFFTFPKNEGHILLP